MSATVRSDWSAGAPAKSNVLLWVGRVLSALPVLMLLMSASMKLSQAPQMVEHLTQHYGYPAGVLVPLGIIELICAVIYAVPQTAVLGAILVTGYLGGAIATHVRAGESFAIPLVLGILAWLGLYLREYRLRAITPTRKTG